MKKEIIILAVVFFSVILQASFFPLFFLARNVPDFVLVFLVSLAVIFGFQRVWIFAIITGFVMDIFSLGRVGINVVSFVFSCYLVSFFSKRVLLGEKTGGIFSGIFLISAVTFFHNFWVIFSGLEFSFQQMWGAKLSFFWGFGWKLLFNLVVFFLSLLVFKRFEKRNSSVRNLLIGN